MTTTMTQVYRVRYRSIYNTVVTRKFTAHTPQDAQQQCTDLPDFMMLDGLPWVQNEDQGGEHEYPHIGAVLLQCGLVALVVGALVFAVIYYLTD